MCGIFGHTKPGGTIERSRAALNTLKHRGPDQWGEWYDEKVYLGHRRLSILDLSVRGKQPMVGGHVVISANGEIYNFLDIKEELAKKYKFKSGSDSEVLIYGYMEWGIDGLLERIEGMYAFSLYDQKLKKLYLVRDRVGIKPLYYSMLGKQVAWASELKALEVFHSDELSVDYTAVYDYLTYLYIPAPKSLYKNVQKLEPAHYLEIDLTTDQSRLKRYWQLRVSAIDTSVEEAAKTVKQLVAESVEEQLISDVPVGFFLSGGMDSSVVVAAAAQKHNKLNTYSIGFDVKEHSETHFAELVAKALKTNHMTRDLSVKEVKNSFNNLKKWYDEPFADTSAFPVYLISTLARPSSTVVLTGDGGDEVFGGYNWYGKFRDQAADYVRQNSSRLSGIRSRLLGGKKGRANLELEFYSQLMGGLTSQQKQTYRSKFNIPADYDDYWYFRNYYWQELPLMTRLQYMDFHTYLPDDILTKVDRASMAVALECRVPLLSTRLIEYLFSLPEDIKYYGGQLKGLMKYAYRSDLPIEVIERDKKGFSIPTGRWQPELMGGKVSTQEFILKSLYPELVDPNGQVD